MRHFSPMPRVLLSAALAALPLLVSAQQVATSSSKDIDYATDRDVGELTPEFLFYEQMPTGVTTTQDGRTFVSYPRWEAGVRYTVAELKNGKEAPYPTLDFNSPNVAHPSESLVSVQSVIAPGDGHVWLLDTGRLPKAGYQASGLLDNGAKLVAVNLETQQIDRTLVLPDQAILDKTYLNDVRFDFSQGKEGVAYITDSGAGAIIVVDLATGDAWRKLDDHPSTQADPEFVPMVEGERLTLNTYSKEEDIRRVPSDGIALSPDGETLYYSPLSGRHLFSVPTRLLRERDVPASQVAEAVTDHGSKGGASDGLLMDASGRLYATDYEHNSIHRYDTDSGEWVTLVHDPRLLWPDTLTFGPDGELYVIANQLHRQAKYQGEDMRHKPYVLFSTPVEAQPIGLR